jgi:GNAT superfamily N-acetyltransferase
MSGAIGIGPPEKLSAAHDLSTFDCGEPALDNWLRRRAECNGMSGASRTYAVCAGRKVVGYYTLAAGAVTLGAMPDPVPVMVLGRLAVDRTFHGRGVGSGILRDAVLRIVEAGEIAGIRAILVHAISADAKRFYEKRGFVASPADPLTVAITVVEAARMLGRAR